MLIFFIRQYIKNLYKSPGDFCEKEVQDLYVDLFIFRKDDSFVATVNGVKFFITKSILGELLKMPMVGIDIVVKKFASVVFLVKINRSKRYYLW